MFGYVNHRFLCIAAASVIAPVLQPTLQAQVQIAGSVIHYRSIEGHRNFGSERFDLLGLGTDPDDGVDFMVTKSNSAEECPSTESLHIYRFDTTLKDWVFDGSIDHLGAAYPSNVDVQGDLIIIGGTFDPAPVPGATIYRRGFGGVWIQEASILPADNVIGDRFGWSVSIHNDLAVVGAKQEGPNPQTFFDGPGSAYIYQLIGNTWTQIDKITAANGQDGEDFGEQVSVHDTPTGPVIIIAAPDRNTTPNSIGAAGSVYSFKQSGGQWTQVDRVEASTTPQNFSGDFGRRIDHDQTTLGVTDNYDLHIITIEPNGSMTIARSVFGTEFLTEVAVAQGNVVVGDPNGGLPSSNGQPNIPRFRASGNDTDFPLPPELNIGDGYGFNIDYNGYYTLAGLPTLNIAGDQAGGIWRQQVSVLNHQMTGLHVVGQASTNAQFGKTIDSTDTWTVIGSPNSINDCIADASGSVRMLSIGIDDWTPFENIYPPMGVTGTGFGSAVAIQGNQMAITMPGYTITGLPGEYGAVFIYEYAFPQWALVQTIEGSQSNDAFGASIALAGQALAIGVPDAPSGGAVKIMRTDATGLFQNDITTSRGDLTPNAHFGHQVSLYQDQLLISAPDDSSATGSVFVLDYDFATGNWNTQPQLTLPSLAVGSRFGFAITQTEDHALIGVPANGIDPGRIALYPRTQQGFGQPIIITQPAGTTQAGFGAYLAAKDNKLIVGYDGPSASIVHVMIDGGSTYQHLQAISVPSGDAGARFGSAMAISAETLFVASPNQTLDIIAGAGVVDLYELEIRFTVPECDMAMNSDYIQWIQDDAPEQGEHFAYSVEVDEGYAIVGSPYERHTFTHDGTVINGIHAGKMTIYERTGFNEWTPVAFFRGGNFDDPIGVQHADWLGWSADIERTTAVAGGIQGRYQNNPAPSGSIRVYERTPAGWIESEEIFPPGVSNISNPVVEYGAAVDLDTTANFIAVGASNSRIGATGTGAGFVLERTVNGWVSTQALVPPTVLFGDHVGKGASVEEGWAAFGTPDDDTNGGSSGAVHLFKRTGLGLWSFHSTIFAPNPHTVAQFGNSLEISRSDLGLTMVVGAIGEREGNVSGVGAGYVFVFDELNDQWNSIQRLLPEFISSSVLYAKDISIDHNTIAIGAPTLRDTGTGPSDVTGGVEVYNLDQSSGQFIRRTTIRPEQNQWNSPNGWGNAIGLSGGTVLLGTSLADGELYEFVNRNFNYGAVLAHDIICVPDCPADLNGDGVLDFFDISAFLTAFASQDPIADLNGDGVINFFDVSAFLAAFSAGC